MDGSLNRHPLGRVERAVRRAYVRWVRPHVATGLRQQRLKLLWDVWGYAPMLGLSSLPVAQRVAVVAKLLRVDWNVPHAHKPRELVAVFRSIGERAAQPGEAVVEAGCWMGGSSAKLSLLCSLFGYRLHIYDSFEGVEQRTAIEGDATDYSGSYAATLETVRAHIARYGSLEVCDFHVGWFADTLAAPPAFRVRGAYIDCDLAKGTAEVLASILPVIADDGWVYSQDYHIGPVRQLLHSADLWKRLARGTPEIEHVYRNLARIRVAASPANAG
jgi:O-methyltransferase